MNRTGRRRAAVLLVGSLVQLAVWLIVRPDRAGPQWTDGTAVELWIGLQTLTALAVGVLAPDRQTVKVTIVVGWLLQMVHLAVLGAHYDDTLWGIGLVVDAVLAAVAVGLALVARRLAGRDEGHSRS